MIRRTARGSAEKSDPATSDPAMPDPHGDDPLVPALRERAGRRPRRGPVLVVVALAILALIPVFVARVYVIPTGSMEQTLHGCAGCDNDRVLVDKLSYRFGTPAPGDVVVFALPSSWTSSELRIPHRDTNPVAKGMQQAGALFGIDANETDFAKRVIAVAGQTVACCDERNRITIDGVGMDEPYISFLPEAGPPRQAAFDPVRIPDGELWVMGDNRNDSVDSRASGNGTVPVDAVIGRIRSIVWPFDRIGAIPDPG